MSKEFDNWKKKQSGGADKAEEFDRRLNTWMDNSDKYHRNAQHDLGRQKYSHTTIYNPNSKSRYKTALSQRNAFQKEGQNLLKMADQYRPFFGEEWYKKVTGAIGERNRSHNQILSAYNQDSRWFDQWKDEDEYRNWSNSVENRNAAQRERDTLSRLDLGKEKEKLDTLQKERDSADQFMRGTWKVYQDDPIGRSKELVDRIEGEHAAIEARGGVDYMDDVIQSRKDRIAKARQIQANTPVDYSDMAPDFQEKSQYRKSGEDKVIHNPVSDLTVPGGDYTYEYINNQDGFRDRVSKVGNPSVKAFLQKADERGLDLLSSEEIQTYNYLYTQSKDEANAYLDKLEATLNQRRGKEMYDNIDSTFDRYAFGVKAGLDQAKGFTHLFSEKYPIPSAVQYASAMNREDMSGFGKFAYDAITTTSNMVPSILAGTISNFLLPGSGAAVGNAMMGASAAGNAYQDAVERGFDDKDARFYSALIGASEVGIGHLLGGIDALGQTGASHLIPKSVLSKLANTKMANKLASAIDSSLGRFVARFGGNMIAEGREEAVQEIIEPWLQNVILGADEKVDLGDVAYSALLGAVTAGLMNAPGEVVNAAVADQETISTGRDIVRSEGGIQNLKDMANRMASVANEKDAARISKQTESIGDEDSRKNSRKVGKLSKTIAEVAQRTPDGKLAEALTDVVENTNRSASGTEEVTAENIPQGYASEDEAIVNETVKDLGIDDESSQKLVESFKANPIKADVWSKGIQDAFRMGQYNIPKNEMSGPTTMTRYLNDYQRTKAYELGQQSAAVKFSGNPKKMLNQKGGLVTFKDPNLRKENLNKIQKTSVEALEKVADAIGVNIVLFESPVVNGVRKGKNGSYDPNTNTIEIDLHAGVSGKDTILFTAGHELTHLIREWSPSHFKNLSDFLMEKYGEKGVSVEKLIYKQILKARESGRKISYDTAFEEVVADSMESMLADGDVVQKLSELRTKDRSLWEKIKSYISELASRIKKLYDSLRPDSAEGRYVKDMKDSIDQFHQLFLEGLTASAENIENAIEADPILNETVSDEVTDIEDSTMFSYRSLAEAAGFDAVEEDGSRFFVRNGSKVKEVTTDDIKKSPIGAFISYSLDKGDFGTGKSAQELADRQYRMFADVCNMAIKTNDFGMAMQFAGSAVFTGMKANADKQYGTTYDFPSICTKTQAVIDAMSARMVKLGRGLTEEENVGIYQDVMASGNPVPCPECYVFSRWIGIGGLLDKIKKYQEFYKDMDISEVAKEYLKQKEEVQRSIDEYNASHPDKPMTFGRGKGKLGDKITKEYNKLSEEISKDDEMGRPVSDARREKLKALETTMNTVTGMSWLEKVYFKDSSLKRKNARAFVPDEVLFDLNKGESFASQYPEAWAFRTTQGAGYGKAITPYADARLGEGILATNNTSKTIKDKASGKLNNIFLQQKGKMNAAARKALDRARMKQKAQAFLGGQRFQSTSDARYENASDYLLAALEMQATHGRVQVYTKVDGAVPAFAAWGFSINQSLMPKYSGLDENGVPIDTNNGGINKRVALENRKKFETAGTITIGVNDNHIRAMFPQEFRDFIIPYHASGGKIELVAKFREIQEGNEKKGKAVQSSDYTRTQSDKILSDVVLRWLGKSESEIKAIADNRQARIDILTGKNPDMEVVKKNRFLLDLYNKTHGGAWDGVTLPKSKFEDQIYPNEFWDESVSYEDSGKITKDYLEYCDSLGFLHRFSGLTPRNGILVPATGYNQFGEKVNLTDLAYKYKDGVKTDEVEDFFWKVLTDRRMYDNEGRYLPQKVVTLNDTTPYTAETFATMNVGKQYNKEVAEKLAKEIANKNYGQKLSDRDYMSAQESEDRINEIRSRLSELDDELMFSDFDDDEDTVKLRKERLKIGYELDNLIHQERMKAVKTSIPDIIENLGKYRRSDLESLAEQVSDGNWDDYEELGRQELEDALKERFEDLLSELSPVERNLKKYGFDVRPIEADRAFSNIIRFPGGEESEVGDQTEKYSLRAKPDPGETRTVYKLMKLGADGNLYPLFIDSAAPISVGNWYDADSPSFEALRDLDEGYYLMDGQGSVVEKSGKKPNKPLVEKAALDGNRWMRVQNADTNQTKRRYAGVPKKFYNVGINGSGSVSEFALRPGWHSGSLPVMDQIGLGKNKNIRDDHFVWVEGKIPYDIDYQAEAESNPDNDIPFHIPVDGSYIKGTSSFVTKGVVWYISGAFEPVRIISDRDARRIVDNFNDNQRDADAPVLHYDFPRDQGRVFNAETMRLEEGNEQEKRRWLGAKESTKLKGFAFGDDIRFSDRDPEVQKLNAHLARENMKLKDDVSYLKELMKLQRSENGGQILTRSQIDAAAKFLIKSSESTGDYRELREDLRKFYTKILKSKSLSWEDISRSATPVVDWLQSHPKAKKTYDDNFTQAMEKQALLADVYDSFWRVSTLKVDGTHRKAEINKLKHDHENAMKDLKNARDAETKALKALHRQEMDNLRRDMIRDRNQKIRDLTAGYRADKKAALADQKESAAKKDARAELQKKVLATAKWVAYPPKDKPKCPDFLKKPYLDFLDSIDLSSKRLREGGDPTQNDLRIASALDSLATAVQNRIVQQDPESENSADDGYLDLPANFAADIRTIAEAFKEITTPWDYDVSRMSSEEIKKLSKIIDTLNQAIRNIDIIYANGRFHSAVKLGESETSFLDSLGELDKDTKTSRFFRWENAVPFYAFKKFGEAGESVFNELMNSQAKLANHAQTIFDFRDKWFKPEELEKWENDVHDITLPSGDVISMTTAQTMSFYLLSKREHAVPHMTGGGIRILGLEKNGKKLADNEAALTVEDINAINRTLDERPRRVAEAIQEFFSTTCSDWGNEISMKRFMTREFTEKNYFPIEVNDENLKQADPSAQQSDLFRLLNISASKPLTPKANNQLIIRDIFDVFVNHSSDMARLNAFGMELLDIMKWLNYKATAPAPNSEDGFLTNGTAKAMRKAYGSGAKAYVINLIKDINGRPNDTDPTILTKMSKLAKTAAVGNSLRVATLQVTSYPRASLILSPQSLALGLRKMPKYNEAIKYCGIAKWKSFGFYDVNIARNMEEQIKSNQNIRDKLIEWSLKGAEWGDALTIGCLWNACSYEVAKTSSNPVGSEEFKIEVGEKLTEVIYATQVVDSPLTRSQLMRSKNAAVKEASSFMSEPTLSTNILMNAYSQFDIARRQGRTAKAAWAKTKSLITRSAAVYAIGVLMESAVGALWDAWRNEDDDDFRDKYAPAFAENIILEINPASKVPVLADLTSMLMTWVGLGYYSGESLYTSFLGRINNAFKACKSAIEGKGTAYNAIYQTLRAVSSMTGVSVSGPVRELTDFWNNTAGAVDPSLKLLRQSRSRTENASKLLDAYISGKKPDAWEDEFDNDESLKSAVKSEVKKRFTEGSISKDDAISLLEEHAGAENAYWVVDEWESGSEDYSKYDDLFEAVKTGKNLKNTIRDYESRGISKESMKTQISNHFKPIYTAMSKSERARLKGYIRNGLIQTGYDEESVDKKLAQWDLIADIPQRIYTDYMSLTEGLRSKEEKVAVIDSMPISSAEKDALYRSEGWSENNLKETPWH